MNKNLKSTVLSGAMLTVVGRLIRAVQGVAVLVILSRYLSPVEFGIIAMTAFVVGIAQIFTDFGTRVALVQKQNVTKLEESSVFWWNLGIATAICVLIMASAPWLARMMGEEAVTTPLLWIAPIFVIGGLQSVPLSVLERRFDFGRIAASEVSAALVSSAVAVGMVLMGFKIEALIGQMISGPIVSAAIIIGSARWLPSVQFSLAAMRPLLSYGGYVTAAALVQVVASRVDRPIVGNRLTAEDVGYSAVAEQIVLSPLRITVQMVRKVMFPVMATIQDDDVRLRRGYVQMQHGVMIIMAPIAFGIWAIADPVVAILLGSGWEMVAVLMGYLSILTIFTTFNDLNSVIFSAKGWAKFQFKWSIFSAILNIAVLLLAVDYGIVAVAAARVALSIALTPLNAYFALRLIQQPTGEVVNLLIRPLAAALVMGLSLVWVQDKMAVSGAGSLLQLLVCIPLGAVIYVAGELLLDRARFLALLRQIRSRGKAG